MARPARIWWWKPKGYWVTDLGGKRTYLAKGWKNKQIAKEKLDEILAEQELLASVSGPISVAALCEQFLDDAKENLAQKSLHCLVCHVYSLLRQLVCHQKPPV